MKEIAYEQLGDNFIHAIAKEWMLVGAGSKDNYNMMTASWGGVGFLWDKPVAFVFVRNSRHTYSFLESNDAISLSFLGNDPEMRRIYGILGSKSGRDIDKMNIPGLSAFEAPGGVVAFNEARLTLTGRKLFVTDMKPENFLSQEVYTRWYDPSCPTGNAPHRIYVMEIEHILVQE